MKAEVFAFSCMPPTSVPESFDDFHYRNGEADLGFVKNMPDFAKKYLVVRAVAEGFEAAECMLDACYLNEDEINAAIKYHNGFGFFTETGRRNEVPSQERLQLWRVAQGGYVALKILHETGWGKPPGFDYANPWKGALDRWLES